jgi:hypothetical protein
MYYVVFFVQKPSTGKKKKKRKWQDNYYLEQLGEGYDENDTFIDNSEAVSFVETC